MSRSAPLAFALLALSACQSATQISVTVQTDVPCPEVTATSFTAGELGGIETAPPTTESATCSAGNLGTVVLVPSGGEDEEVAFKVVTALNGETPETCSLPAAASNANCIVARRALRYLPHTPLEVIVDMTAACEGQICDEYSTCVSGVCVNATISDPSQCEAAGCNASVLATEDAGADATGSDATTDATIDSTIPLEGGDAQGGEDSALPDSPPPAEASAFDGEVLGCDLGGLQPGSPWPMEGYCPSLRSRSPLVGPPPTPVSKWAFNFSGSGFGSPSIGADGTIYIGSVGDPLPDGGLLALAGGAVVALHPDGGVVWTFAPDGGAAFYQVPVIAADSTLRFFDLFAGTYDILALDGSVVDRVGTIGSRGGLTIVSGGTMYVPDTDGNLTAYTGTGSVRWSVPGVGTDFCFPSVAASGVIFSENGSNLATGVYPDGGVDWQRPLDAGVPIGLSSILVAPDGTLRVYDTNGDLWSLDPTSGAPNWHHPFASAGAINGFAIADDGNTYLATQDGILAINAGGTQVGSQTGTIGTPVIDANGDIYAVCNDGSFCSFDHALATQRWSVPVPNWLDYDNASRPVIGPGGMIYIVSSFNNGAGALYAFGPAP